MQRGMLIVNGEDRGLTVSRCTNFVERGRGLLGRPPLEAFEVLWISPCASVHTFGMRYAIDVLFCDFKGTVIRVVKDLEPGRIAMAIGARSACELRSGVVQRVEISAGDQLRFDNIDGALP